ADGEFFRKVTKSIPYRQSGVSIFTVDGTVLEYSWDGTAAGTVRLMESALRKFQPPDRPYVLEPQDKVDENNHQAMKPPEGGLVANCIMTFLNERGVGYYHGHVSAKLLAETASMDRVWVGKEEAQALAKGQFPDSLKRRIARWHLIDNTLFGRNADQS